MKPLDRLDWEILNATADDWENPEQIAPAVSQIQGATEEEIGRRLVALVARGLLAARLPESSELLTAVPPKEVARAWFRMTEAGREAWAAESGTLT
jgi:hypothetical protein